MEGDDDRTSILSRRAQWIAMALSVVGAPACDAPPQDPPAGSTTTTGPATNTAALQTARPAACLSYSCPAGSTMRPGYSGGTPMTARPMEGDCVPLSSLRDPHAPAQVEPVPSGSALAIDESKTTKEIPPLELRALLGCWQASDGDERWIFRRKGAGGLEVVREIGDKQTDKSYADRAREPYELSYLASADSYAFRGAGRIHAVAFTFQRKGEELHAQTYSSRAPNEPYRSTANTLSLRRCQTR